jgi:NADH:ubiquinone oxidoreductase subunit 2 (subunit N)
MMYMREPRGEVPVVPVSATAGLAIAICVLATLYLGVVPGRALNYVADSARHLVAEPAVSATSANALAAEP